MRLFSDRCLSASIAFWSIASTLFTAMPDVRGDDRPLATLPTGGEARQVAFSPDGKLLAATVHNFSSGHADLVIFSYADREKIKEISNVSPSFAFSPDGKWLAVAGLEGPDKIVLLDSKTWKPGPWLSASEARPDADFRRFAFSPDSKQVLSATAGGIVELWDVASQKRIGAWSPRGVKEQPAPISFLGFTLAGKPVIAMGIRDVIVREMGDDAKAKAVGPLDIGIFSVHVAALSSDGRSFATAGVAEPKLFDLAGGKWKSDLKGVTGHTYGMTFTSDDRLIITTTMNCKGNKDGTWPAAVQVRVWDASTGKELSALRGKLPGVLVVAAAPDGQTFVTGGDKEIDVWDLKKLIAAATPMGQNAPATTAGASKQP
jgi:WD40 repeat protein